MAFKDCATCNRHTIYSNLISLVQEFTIFSVNIFAMNIVSNKKHKTQQQQQQMRIEQNWWQPFIQFVWNDYVKLVGMHDNESMLITRFFNVNDKFWCVSYA